MELNKLSGIKRTHFPFFMRLSLPLLSLSFALLIIGLTMFAWDNASFINFMMAVAVCMAYSNILPKTCCFCIYKIGWFAAAGSGHSEMLEGLVFSVIMSPQCTCILFNDLTLKETFANLFKVRMIWESKSNWKARPFGSIWGVELKLQRKRWNPTWGNR